MKKDSINGNWFNVSILNRGTYGDTLCYKVYSDQLGEFDIINCHYNTDPSYFKEAKFHLNGSASINTEDEGVCDFFVVLTLCYKNQAKGIVVLRC